MIVIRDRRQRDAFTMAERDVHLPILPLQLVAVHLETNALWLDNMQRLDVVPRFEVGIVLEEVGQEVECFPWRGNTRPI